MLKESKRKTREKRKIASATHLQAGGDHGHLFSLHLLHVGAGVLAARLASTAFVLSLCLRVPSQLLVIPAAAIKRKWGTGEGETHRRVDGSRQARAGNTRERLYDVYGNLTKEEGDGGGHMHGDVIDEKRKGRAVTAYGDDTQKKYRKSAATSLHPLGVVF